MSLNGLGNHKMNISLSKSQKLIEKLRTYIPTLEPKEEYVEHAVLFIVKCYATDFGLRLERPFGKKQKLKIGFQNCPMIMSMGLPEEKLKNLMRLSKR